VVKRKVKHPAKYSDVFIPIFAGLLYNYNRVLDPFAGTGKLAAIKDYGFTGQVVCCEIEPEWAKCGMYSDVDEWHIGDSRRMGWAEDEQFDAICTSPTYGNRMADHHNARDGSRRMTYRHTLGRELHKANSGRMQWGERYRKLHEEVYAECWRVLSWGGRFVLNVSNHIRNGQEVDVVGWHRETLLGLGFEATHEIEVLTRRMRRGANHERRVATEKILVFDC
jgi:tRNA G10  N-methylase Trm11